MLPFYHQEQVFATPEREVWWALSDWSPHHSPGKHMILYFVIMFRSYSVKGKCRSWTYRVKTWWPMYFSFLTCRFGSVILYEHFNHLLLVEFEQLQTIIIIYGKIALSIKDENINGPNFLAPPMETLDTPAVILYWHSSHGIVCHHICLHFHRLPFCY